MSNCCRLFLFSLFLLLTSVGWAKPSERLNLQDYIQKTCPRTCVDGRVLNTVVKNQAKKYKIDPKIILAIIRVESSFNVKAKGGGAVGLTQVMPRWHHKKFKGKNYFQVNDNVAVGTQVFKACQDKMLGSVRRSLRCYNGGGDNNYAPKVLRAYAEIKRLQSES